MPEMVSAQVAGHEAFLYATLKGEPDVVDIVAARDAQGQAWLDEARDESAALKASYDNARLALAAAQAELREAREALAKIEQRGRKFNSPWSREVAVIAGAFLSRPASDGALREMLTKVAQRAAVVIAKEIEDDAPWLFDAAAIVSEIMEGK